MGPEPRDILTIVHLFGVVLGAGGAFMSDAMFLSSAADLRFTRTELRFLKLGSIFVWTGLAVLLASGAGMFLLDPERYMASSKFLAKMTIVAVIAANGLAFHFLHFPTLHSHADTHVGESATFRRKRTLLLGSGALSVTSWVFALVLGSLRSLPFSYGVIMLVYAGAAIFAVVSAVLLRDVILPKVPGRLRAIVHRLLGED